MSALPSDKFRLRSQLWDVGDMLVHCGGNRVLFSFEHFVLMLSPPCSSKGVF